MILNKESIHKLISTWNQPTLAMDLNASVLYCNKIILSLYGINEKELLNKNYFDECSRLMIPMPALSLASLLDENENTVTSHKIDQQLRTKTFQWTTSKLQEPGQSNIVLLLGHDVTTIFDKATNDRLLWDSMIDYVPAQIFWKDKQLVYLGCNKSFVDSLGLNSKQEIIGKTDFDLPVDPKDSVLYRVDDRHIISSLQPKLNIEERQHVADRGQRVLSTSKVPLINDNGEAYGVLGIYRDITDQKQAEAALNNAKKIAENASYAKTEFIANMSHDIRTPLSGVVGLSQLLVDTLLEVKQKQYALWIHECSTQLLSLLNEILGVMSEDKVDRRAVHSEVFSLRECVYDIVQLERPSTQMKFVDFNVMIDDDVPDLLVSDRSRIYRILLNLLGNAIKFTSNGSVTLIIKKQSFNMQQISLNIQVIDTGIGIPLDAQDKIFDRFYRASPSYKGVYSGHGIGLHIAKSYVNDLGSDLFFTSKEGEGTTFYFNLVCNLAENQKDDTIDASMTYCHNKSAEHRDLNCQNLINVLLVEDNYIALKVLESITEAAKLSFMSATDGETAFDLVMKNQFNLIITDIGLPGMSGNELAQAIRVFEKSQKKSPTYIIGLTAHARESIRDECLKAGMNEVYTKPMSLETIQNIINGLH